MNEAIELFRAGGWVMWPIAVVSLAIAYLAWERVAYVWRSTRFDAGRATIHWSDAQPAERTGRDTAIERILRYTFAGPAATRRGRFHESVAAEAHALGERLGVLGTLVAAAPLLGLLGTVTGMIETFDTLEAIGASSPQALSGGISQALFTTQAGLLVSLPGLYAHRWLVRRKRMFEQELARVERELAPAFEEAV